MNLNNLQRKVRSGPGGSTFRAEKAQAARIKEIVPSSGFKSVSPNGVTSIPDFDSYCEQYQSLVTFEPLAQTWHVKMG